MAPSPETVPPTAQPSGGAILSGPLRALQVALELAETGIPWSAALELAKAYAALGRHQEAEPVLTLQQARELLGVDAGPCQPIDGER